MKKIPYFDLLFLESEEPFAAMAAIFQTAVDPFLFSRLSCFTDNSYYIRTLFP